MQELITKLTEKAGISSEQAHKAIETIKDFVKDKFPMMAGAVDNLFASENTGSSNTSKTMTDSLSDEIKGVL